MNIFFLDDDPEKCAKMHNNSHCVKMILEYAQLLSTAHRVLDGYETTVLSDSGHKKKVWKLHNHEFDHRLYSATHINHPCAVWVRQSSLNYTWLSILLRYLCAEYTYRYGKVHKVERDGLMDLLYYNHPKNIKTGMMTEPVLAMPEDCKEDTAIQSYRSYYINHKQHLAKWNGKVNSRKEPWWYMENQIADISVS